MPSSHHSRPGSVARSLLLIGLLLLLVVGSYIGWQWIGADSDATPFRTEPVTQGRVVALINASGTVVPQDVVDVGAQVAGKIESFGTDLLGHPIDYRSPVKEGTVLAFIDRSLYAPEVTIAEAELALAQAEVQRAEADLQACEARLAQASSDLSRARRLAGSSTIAASEVDQFQQLYLTARASVPAANAMVMKGKQSVKVAEGNLEKARTNLRYCTIVSPVDGVIIDRRVNIGQTVVASLNAPSLFLIAKDLKKMQVWASVNEADIGLIYSGQPAAFRVDAFPDRVFEGKVEQVRLNATMTQNVVTYTVVVSVDNSDLALLPYLTANIQFKVGVSENVLRVPNAALRYRPPLSRIVPEHAANFTGARQKRTVVAELVPGSHQAEKRGTVWVVQGSYVRPVTVQIGLTDGGVTEIEPVDDALKPGDDVVVGEEAPGSGGSSNPFQVKMFSGKKKE